MIDLSTKYNTIQKYFLFTQIAFKSHFSTDSAKLDQQQQSTTREEKFSTKNLVLRAQLKSMIQGLQLGYQNLFPLQTNIPKFTIFNYMLTISQLYLQFLTLSSNKTSLQYIFSIKKLLDNLTLYYTTTSLFFGLLATL